MATTVSTVVKAAPGSAGQCEQLRRISGVWQARTINYFVQGEDEVSPWTPITTEEAANIIDRAEGHVPSSWRQLTGT